MSSAECLNPVDVAMRSPDSEAILDDVESAFEGAGRKRDALTAAVLRTLLRMGEIETVMLLRSEGRARAPRGASRLTSRPPPAHPATA